MGNLKRPFDQRNRQMLQCIGCAKQGKKLAAPVGKRWRKRVWPGGLVLREVDESSHDFAVFHARRTGGFSDGIAVMDTIFVERVRHQNRLALKRCTQAKIPIMVIAIVAKPTQGFPEMLAEH